jgi:hypothetical protein
MILLTNTTETLNVDTLTAGKIDYTAYYADHTSTTFTASSNQGTVSAIASTAFVAAPAASTQRQVKTLIITNRDASPTAQTVFVKKSVAGVDTYLTANTPLGTGESLQYLERRGWKVLNRQGAVKYQTAVAGPVPTISLGPVASNMMGTTRAHLNTACWGVYVGKSPRYPVTQLNVRWRVTVAAVGTTWAEIGVYVGTSQHGANCTTNPAIVQARCVGFADVSANVASAVAQYTTINTMTGYAIPPDEDVWVVFNSEFATSGCTLSASHQDDLASGTIVFITAQSRRPSVDLGQAVGIQALSSLSVAPTFQVYW